MLGSQSLGAIYFGGFIVFTTGEVSQISAETTGIENVSNEIDAKTTGVFQLQRRPKQRIVVKNKSGVALGEFDIFRNLKYGKKLNYYGTCSFDIPINDQKLEDLYDSRNYEVYIYIDNTLVWAGEQVARVPHFTADGEDWATITCYTWLEMLNHRFTVAEKIYDILEDNLEMGEIAWDLINETQNDGSYGDLGFTQGTIQTTPIVGKKYYNQNIMQAIIDLSQERYGFDFNFTDEKVFGVYTFFGNDKTNKIMLEYGYNFKECTVVENFANPSTRAIILGQSFDGSELLRVERDDLTAQASHRLREYVVSQSDVSDLDVLEGIGDEVNRMFKQPVFSLSPTLVKNSNISIKDFTIGDIIRVRLKKGIYDIDLDMRVQEWNMSITEEGDELSLVLSVE